MIEHVVTAKMTRANELGLDKYHINNKSAAAKSHVQKKKLSCIKVLQIYTNTKII